MTTKATITTTGAVRGVGYHIEIDHGNGRVDCVAVARTPDGTFGVARVAYKGDDIVGSEVVERDDYLAASVAAEQFKRAIVGGVIWRRVDGGYTGVGPTGRRAELEAAGRGRTAIWLYDERGQVALGVVRAGGVKRSKAYAADYLVPGGVK